MPASLNQQAIKLLRDFATFESSGLRGITINRMRRMQADAVNLLARIDAKAAPKQSNKKEPS